MTKKESQIIRRIRDEIKSTDHTAQVILFGSRAKGVAKKDSDWDVLILIDDSDTSKTEDLLRDRLFDLEIETGEVISLFVYSKKEWKTKYKVTPLYQIIKREGILL